MKLDVATHLTRSADAFAPAQVGKATTALNAFDFELGSQVPIGFFNPLGMLVNANQERCNCLRYVGVKNGRVAELAFLRKILTHNGIHLYGYIEYSGIYFESNANIWEAISIPNTVPQAGLIQIFLFVGALELAVMKDVTGESDLPRDF